jgi:glycine cleavage system regulatory protein
MWAASVHPAQDSFIWVALAVVDENAAVEEFTPVFFFGGV